jgi:hypothetical protein
MTFRAELLFESLERYAAFLAGQNRGLVAGWLVEDLAKLRLELGHDPADSFELNPPTEAEVDAYEHPPAF